MILRRQPVPVSVLVAVAVAFTFSVGFAGDPADTMTMESKVYKKHKKGPVTFTHKKHANSPAGKKPQPITAWK